MLFSYLPWQLNLIILSICLVIILYQLIKFWKSKLKILSIAFGIWVVLIIQLGIDCLREGLGYKALFIFLTEFYILLVISIFLMIAGTMKKLKKEDDSKIRPFVRFVIIMVSILVTLFIAILISIQNM
ncbi:hypothetical protein [Desulfosporosinus youngiae]|uniref:Uncharacterized protein n=1 Tax=Desulfosporosinus youngiae DSM 17734 TaxID=768710 RepID=H5XVN3_9FIRM|nr:hypothetical protein [Desulfosporosinus youngiae]EHQ90116.1 hypothetical protein DesyoDRAFT_3076 [Desulfosporosinus youngiae DSM 17734]